MDVRRLAVPAALVPLVLGGVTGDVRPEAQPQLVSAAAACRPAPGLLQQPPKAGFRLPGGATVRIWDTGHRSAKAAKAGKTRGKPGHRLHLVVVTVPRASLVPRVATAPTLARAVPLREMVRRDRRAVLALNGGHFFAGVPGIPTKSQIANGVLRKGTHVPQANVAVYADARAVTLARARLAGTLRTERGPLRVSALNWQRLPVRGFAVYTHAWGNRPHPAGPRTLVVGGDEVRAVLGREHGVRRPPPGQVFVTARAGPRARLLRTFRVGDTVEVSVTPTGRRVSTTRPRPALGRPSGLLGVGGTLVDRGVNRSVCNRRNEMRRPRSMLGWRRDGALLVLAASGRGAAGTLRGGGLTVHQGAELMRALGAVRVVNFDGGSSTTLLVRRQVGGPLLRLDAPWSRHRPRVVDGLAFRVPG